MENKKIEVTARCPIRTSLELIGGKWKLLILQQLISNKPLRLSALAGLIPDISQKMLIQKLKTLTDSELVKREDFQEALPRVEYSITKKGLKVQPLIKELILFAQLYEVEFRCRLQEID
jgi:DNA-binding HxlR family transcriptional regulator